MRHHSAPSRPAELEFLLGQTLRDAAFLCTRPDLIEEGRFSLKERKSDR
jgi:hypothetical protein